MKKVALVIILVLVVLGIGLYYNHLTQPKIVSSSSEQVSRCLSLDNRNYYSQGEVSFLYENESGPDSTIPDWCQYNVDGKFSERGLLRQSYCSGNELVTEYIDCGIDSVCRQGACYKGGLGQGRSLQKLPICHDSDGGKNYPKQGSVEGYGSGKDECYIIVNKDGNNLDNNSTAIDTCSGDNCYLKEYFCGGNSPAYELVKSPKGCLNGVI